MLKLEYKYFVKNRIFIQSSKDIPKMSTYELQRGKGTFTERKSTDCTLLSTRVHVPDALGRTQDHFCIFDAKALTEPRHGTSDEPQWGHSTK